VTTGAHAGLERHMPNLLARRLFVMTLKTNIGDVIRLRLECVFVGSGGFMAELTVLAGRGGRVDMLLFTVILVAARSAGRLGIDLSRRSGQYRRHKTQADQRQHTKADIYSVIS